MRKPWEMTFDEVLMEPPRGYHDALFRIETGRKTDYPFYTDDTRFAAAYEGEPTVVFGVLFNNPLIVDSKAEAAEKVLGYDPYPKEMVQAGRYTEIEKRHLEVDELLAEEAKKQGYDVIQTPYEIQIIDKSKLPEPTSLTFDEDESMYRLPDGSFWFEGQGHRELIKRKIVEGEIIQPEILAEYPDLTTYIKEEVK